VRPSACFSESNWIFGTPLRDKDKQGLSNDCRDDMTKESTEFKKTENITTYKE
jgi:hypothetical protein